MPNGVSIWELPEVPAVFALHGGPQRRLVFVSLADSLLERILEQLVIPNLRLRPPSRTLYMLPGYLNEIRWWEHPEFADAHVARAAEFVAAGLLEPLFSSRRPSTSAANVVYDDPVFQERMRAVFRGPPSGVATIPTLDDVMERLSALEARFSDGERP